MKKLLILLLFIPLVFACSDDEDTSQNFLEKYNGVYWSDVEEWADDNGDNWFMFSPDGWTNISYNLVGNGVCETTYHQWGVFFYEDEWNEIENMVEVIENSVDKLVVVEYSTNEEPITYTLTVLNGGNNLLMTNDSDVDEVLYTSHGTDNSPCD